jgi:hypothetical protein
MNYELSETAQGLEILLEELEKANLPIAAAHVSTAVELLQAEIRRRVPVEPQLRIVRNVG